MHHVNKQHLDFGNVGNFVENYDLYCPFIFMNKNMHYNYLLY